MNDSTKHNGRDEWNEPEALMDDPERFHDYLLAHHVAGHHWAANRDGRRLTAAGLARGDNGLAPARIDYEHAVTTGRSHLDAAALLCEALSAHAAIHAANELDFTFDDLDLTEVLEFARLSCEEVDACTCARMHPEVLTWLADIGFVVRALQDAMQDWRGIHALARTLHRGNVLEADQVAATLRGGRR